MGLKINWCIWGMSLLLENKVNFKRRQDTEFTVIMLHNHIMSTNDELPHLQVNETRGNEVDTEFHV